jgi:hypothetical protein
MGTKGKDDTAQAMAAMIPKQVTMDELQKLISAWAESTFVHDEKSIAAHMLAEAAATYKLAGGDMGNAYAIVHWEFVKEPRPGATLAEKTGDVGILAFCLAGYARFSLRMAVIDKWIIDLGRKWGKQTDLGFTEHVEEAARQDGGAD